MNLKLHAITFCSNLIKIQIEKQEEADISHVIFVGIFHAAEMHFIAFPLSMLKWELSTLVGSNKMH